MIMEERKPMYFRDGGLGAKQFQELNSTQQKEHLDMLLQLKDEVLDSRDKYIITFYTKVFYPNLRKEDNKLFITLNTNEREATL
jgi:hypothetical protein